MSDDPLTLIRQQLHQHAETAFQESATAATVLERLQQIGIQVVATDVAGHGILACTGAGTGGKRILLRADLDAVPLDEASGVPYACKNGAHHACGHDGHMAMLLGGLEALVDDPPCEVWALFQPAEETGEGMAACLQHDAFPDRFDHVLTIHNVPGHPLGSVLVREGPAAVASTGVVLRFSGATSHAAEPARGRNPIPAVGRLTAVVESLAEHGDKEAVAAIVHVRGGALRFGTSAGDCMLAATLRAGSDDALRSMVGHLIGEAEKEASAGGFRLEVEEVEPFPATSNDPAVVAAVHAAAQAVGSDVQDPGVFPWSEDFGHATARWPGALVGLGSGEEQPALHSPEYDFPDALVRSGARLWVAMVEALA